MRRGELIVGLGITLLGLALAISTYLLPAATATTQVGPKVFPALIAAGLLITGLLLLRENMTGGFRNLPAEARDALDLRAVLWISAGVLLHMALIGLIGFIIASTFLLVAVARGFGSLRLIRDALTGLALAFALYAIFTYGLGLSLGPVFGAAGS